MLRDPEVSTIAASVLKGIINGIGPDANVLKIIEKSLTQEKDEAVKKMLAAIIEECQNYKRTLKK